MLDLRDRLAAALSPRYIVDREFASGGMGVVFLGHDPVLGREVAIKVLPPERATAVAVERFLREARLLAQLTHPHIVPVLEAQQFAGLLWYVMPRIQDDTLAHRLMAGPLSATDVRRLGLDLLSALEHAHGHGVIHRDIKPSNIFLQSGRGMLADFGVAALLDSSQGDTLTGAAETVGTVRYMSPEQCTGGAVTERSDVYAIGVTLFEAATGRRWQAGDSISPRLWGMLPRRLARVLRGALHADPARRWPDARTFRRELAAARRWKGRDALAITAVSVVIIGAILGSRRTRPAPTAPGRRDDLLVMNFTGPGDTLGLRVTQYALIPLGFSIPLFPETEAAAMGVDAARHASANVVGGMVAAYPGGADTLELRLYDSTSRAPEFVKVPGGAADVAGWGRAAADSIVRHLFPQRLSEFRLLAGSRPSRAALDAYAAGLQLFQSGEWQAAEVKFQDAEALDTLFLLATWQKLVARQWQRRRFEPELARLAAQSGRLPPALRELVRIQMEPDLERRVAAYDTLARRAEYRDDARVREMAANELFSRGPLVGLPLQVGIDSFVTAARQIDELNRATTYTQTVWGAVRIGNEALAREQFRLRKAAPNDQWSDMLWLAINGRFRRWLAVPVRQILLWTADSARIATLSQAVRFGLEVDDPWDQLAIGRTLERRAKTDAMRASALAAQATALLLTGRPLRALADLDRGAGLVPANPGYQLQRGEWRVLLPLLPGAPVMLPDSERAIGRAILRAVPAEDSLVWRARWALLIDAIGRRNDRERDSLLVTFRAGSAVPGVPDLLAFAEAIASGARTQVDSALGLSRRIHRVPSAAEAGTRGPLLRALVYLSRGDWQRLRNSRPGAESEWIWHENNDVQGWPAGEPEEGELDAALSAVARLLRGENLLKMYRATEGCDLLRRVQKLWSDAEPAFKPLQTRAATALQACHG